MRKLNILLLMLASVTTLSARVWHVSASGSDLNDGSAQSPIKTISHAALYALVGDTVLIGQGVYREMVSPANSGFNDMRIVTYFKITSVGEVQGVSTIEEW